MNAAECWAWDKKMESAMIINMEDYRRIDKKRSAGAHIEHDIRRHAYGNTAPVLQLATAVSETTFQDSLDLPRDFDDFDAREFMFRAHALATHI
jgi:hypothetical protein